MPYVNIQPLVFYDFVYFIDYALPRSLYSQDCLNFKKSSSGYVFDSTEYEKYRMSGSRIIHWLPADDKSLVKVKVLMPDATFSKGLAESAAAEIKTGEIVQFARFGFCRLESKGERELSFIYCHN